MPLNVIYQALIKGLGMESKTLEFLPILDTISFSNSYDEYDEDVSCALEHVIKTHTFEMKTPLGWDFTEDLCAGVYAGRIESESTTLFFEQSRNSFESIKKIEEKSSTLYIERFLINGADAVIHREYCEESRSNILSLYTEYGALKNKIFVFNTSNEEAIVRMFKTHRFL